MVDVPILPPAEVLQHFPELPAFLPSPVVVLRRLLPPRLQQRSSPRSGLRLRRLGAEDAVATRCSKDNI